MAEKFAGKYTFVSQDNFGEYLKADGMNLTYHLYCLKNFNSPNVEKKNSYLYTYTVAKIVVCIF